MEAMARSEAPQSHRWALGVICAGWRGYDTTGQTGRVTGMLDILNDFCMLGGAGGFSSNDRS